MSGAPIPEKDRIPPTWRFWWRIAMYRPGLYLAFGVLEVLFFAAFPQAAGLVVRLFFNSLTGSAPVRLASRETGPYVLAALFVGIALARAVAAFADVTVYFNFRYSVEALLRKNLFERILERPGASAVPGSPGEAISRFRDDVYEVAFFMAELLTLVAFSLFALAAVIVMARTDARITLFVFLPLLVILAAASLAMDRVQKYRQASRKAGGRVTGFIGEMFGAAQAIQVNAAEDRVIQRFRQLNDARRATTLKDRLFTELLNSISRNTVNLGTGVILLVAGQAMRFGRFTIGDLAIFVYYLGFAADFTASIGTKLAWCRQVGVSIKRLVGLLQGAPPETLVKHSPIYIHGEPPPTFSPRKMASHRLERLH